VRERLRERFRRRPRLRPPLRLLERDLLYSSSLPVGMMGNPLIAILTSSSYGTH
jgi:hypothetical protein